MSDHHATHQSSAVLLDHDADGIREYDNALPGWWTMIFWATIVFSFFYPFYYHWGVGATVTEEYEAEVAEAAEAQVAKLGRLTPDNATIVALSTDDKKVLVGRAMFRTNCAVCHGADGGGGVGPNLCDGTYINIKSPEDIARVIKTGVVAKGMPAWSSRYNDTQIALLSAYVASLRGTTPAAPKAPQGDFTPPAWNTFGATEPTSAP